MVPSPTDPTSHAAASADPIWEADFYRRPLADEAGNRLWELVLCDRARTFVFRALCPQAEAGADWLVEQLRQAAGDPPAWPAKLCVFRPQSVSLFEAAGQTLGLPVEPTRRADALKTWLRDRQARTPWPDPDTGRPYDALTLERPAPLPLPENLWGDRWRFGAIAAGDLARLFGDRPIPFRATPDDLWPERLGLASSARIPGAIVDGGRRSLALARWLAAARPVALNFVPGDPDGLVLEAGLVDRWIAATFSDPDVRAAGETFEARKADARGLHFLLVQPDESGMTYTGLWFLKAEAIAPQ